MNTETFTRNDVVLLHQGHGHVGVIRCPHLSGFLVDFAAGETAWLVAESLTKLPAGTPVFRCGDVARIAADAPVHPGESGMVERPGFEPLGEPAGDVFGYWLTLHGTGEQVWVPASALTAG